MSKISEIDKNFKVKTSVDKEDIVFFDVLEKPFNIYGIFYENGKFRRMPEDAAKAVSPAVHYLHSNTAGGRVCFTTDSPYVAIHAKMENVTRMSHFSFSGSAGFDIYDSTQGYLSTFVPPDDMTDGYDSVVNFPDSSLREITIHFPSYSDVSELYIGISESAKLESFSPYKKADPIVYYGSSITQGGCASRPGNSYQNMLCRSLGFDYINLGFSGSAKGEDEIAEYIKTLDMSVFVYDYDYNAPSTEHLKNTHEKMFKTIRAAKPDLPIIILPRPKYYLTDALCERIGVIEATYKNAVAAGDKNVYWLDGKALLADCRDEGTVDGCHPTDWGFACMAKALEKMIARITV